MKKIAQKFKALSDETRLRILALLSNGEMCVCDLMAILELPQSTVSRHLAYLRNAGWVEDRRQGVWMYYRLSTGDGAFANELRELLRQHLVDIPQAARDREALAAFRTGKIPDCCA
jgi:ArsR family transcriptional regulator